MKIEIVEKVENPLLKRVEIKFKVNWVGWAHKFLLLRQIPWKRLSKR